MNGVFMNGMTKDGSSVEEARDAGSLGAFDETDGVCDDGHWFFFFFFSFFFMLLSR